MEVDGISSVEVEFVDIRRNSRGEGGLPFYSDTEARKRGEQMGLDTPVVHALKYEY